MVVALELATLGVLLHSVAPALPDRLPESLALVLCFLGSFVLHHRCAAARLLGKAGCALERPRDMPVLMQLVIPCRPCAPCALHCVRRGTT